MDDLRPESLKRLLVLFLFFLHPALSRAEDKAAISVSRARELLDQFATVEGKVVEERKGGYTVSLAGINAFCPYSQIDFRSQNPEFYIGKTLILAKSTSRSKLP